MALGREGAEVLADTLQTVFSPLVETIYLYDGFIAEFAGDAFTALFLDLESVEANSSASSEGGSSRAAQKKASPRTSVLRALSAAWRAKAHVEAYSQISTDFGLFNFAIKISVSWGSVEWCIWENRHQARLAQSCAYTFQGDAIDQAMKGDVLAEPGQIIFGPSILDHLPPSIEWQRLDEQFGLLLSIEVSAPRRVRPEPSESSDRLVDFFPSQLLNFQLGGEFRPIVTLFLSFETLPVPGSDEDLVPLILKLLHEYGGFLCRIDRSKAMSRLLIFWGAPVSYENNLDRALEFCLATQQASSIPLRAGITYQIGYAGFIGSALRTEYTCYGSHVNLASRLMFSAPWREIWLDQDSAQRVARTFDLSFIGDHKFKGFVHPQPVFLLRGRRSTPVQHFFSGRIVGRERELRQLRSAVQPIFQQEFAGVIAVTGEAGVGKSRLLHELIRCLEEMNHDVQRANCQSDEILRQSLNPFRYFLRSRFGQSQTATEARNKANFNASLDALINQLPKRKLAKELDRTRSALGALIDLQWDNSFYDQLEPHLRFENVLSALKNYLLACSLLRPLIILVEDAQWLDEDSQHFIQRLARNVDFYPIAIIIVSRESVPLRVEPFRELAIEPLPDKTIQEIAWDRLQIRLSNEQLNQLVQRTGGNPLFVEQMLLYLHDNNLLSAQQVDSSLPDDAQAVFVARLDKLSTEIRQVVQTAAVLGREFEIPILTRLLLDEDVQTKVQIAAEKSIWYSIDQLRYLFRHALLREAAYGMQLRTRRRQLHATAASAIKTLYSGNLAAHYGEIAYHYEQADEPQKAFHFSARAAQLAKNNYKNREALDHYERMLIYLTAEEYARERLAVLQQKAEVLRFIDRYEDALEALSEAAVLGTQINLPLEVGKISVSMGSIELLKGEFEEARRLLNQGVSILKAGNAHEELGPAYRELGNVWEGLGNYDQASACFQLALEAFEEANDPFGKARTLIGLGIVAWNEGAFELAEELYKQSRRIFEALDDQYNAAIAITNLANVALVRKDWGTARSYYESSLKTFEQCGNTLSQATILGNLGIVHFNMGDYEASRACNLSSYTINWEIGSVEGAIYNKINLANIAIVLRQTEDAATDIQAALQLAQQLKSPRLMLEALLPAAAYFQTIDDSEKALYLCKLIRLHPATHAYLLEMMEPIQSEVEAAMGIENVTEWERTLVHHPLEEVVTRLVAGQLDGAAIP